MPTGKDSAKATSLPSRYAAPDSGLKNGLSKWAIVGFKDDTGIGRMAQDIQKVLGIGYHLVAPSERMETKTSPYRT